MPTQLTGRPIIITGASSGIGRATAVACARAGMPVAIAARRLDRLEAVAEDVRAVGGRAEVFQLDVADADACRSFVEFATDRLGPIYSCFANAGYGVEKAALEMTDEQWRHVFEVNFFGTLNLLRPAVEHMKEHGSGHCFICSSCLARFPIPYYAAYCASKASQHHLGRAMDIELREHGIRVSTVHPIGTRTEFFEVARVHSGGRAKFEHTEDGFMQSPEFVASRVVNCLRRPRSEVWTGAKGGFVRWSMGLTSAVPGLGSFGMQRELRRRQKKCEAVNGAEPVSVSV